MSESDGATGQCLQCRTPNSYASVTCSECGARLPWADALKAREQAGRRVAQEQPKVDPPNTPVLGTLFDVVAHEQPKIDRSDTSSDSLLKLLRTPLKFDLRSTAKIMLVLGLLCSGYFFMFFDTSVECRPRQYWDRSLEADG